MFLPRHIFPVNHCCSLRKTLPDLPRLFMVSCVSRSKTSDSLTRGRRHHTAVHLVHANPIMLLDPLVWNRSFGTDKRAGVGGITDFQ